MQASSSMWLIHKAVSHRSPAEQAASPISGGPPYISYTSGLQMDEGQGTATLQCSFSYEMKAGDQSLLPEM